MTRCIALALLLTACAGKQPRPIGGLPITEEVERPHRPTVSPSAFAGLFLMGQGSVDSMAVKAGADHPALCMVFTALANGLQYGADYIEDDNKEAHGWPLSGRERCGMSDTFVLDITDKTIVDVTDATDRGINVVRGLTSFLMGLLAPEQCETRVRVDAVLRTLRGVPGPVMAYLRGEDAFVEAAVPDTCVEMVVPPEAPEGVPVVLPPGVELPPHEVGS
jgi:hypothetical protein